ncbi:hypothetical protein [Roseovarius sp. 2305UL8-3]|uniref:hypothetical protein n=1 Tax=Roseovarius conchicola TaxID=3121636 RepID=UPI003527762E
MTALQEKAPETHEAWGKLGFVPGKTLRVFGMRRSGNHAIINWLQCNAPNGRSVFMNHCKPGADPFQTFKSVEIDAVRLSRKKAQANLAGFCADVGDGAMLLMSYEDSAPVECSVKNPISGPFDETLLDADVLIYRSFLNWAASLFKKLSVNEDYTEVGRAAILLRTCETYTRLLKRVASAETSGTVPVCYDDWRKDPSYRASTLARLGLPMRDNSLGEIQPYGGGSSFQKDIANADELATGQRWQQMAHDPRYQLILAMAARDTDLMAVLTQLFPKDASVLAKIAARVPLEQELFQ